MVCAGFWLAKHANNSVTHIVKGCESNFVLQRQRSFLWLPHSMAMMSWLPERQSHVENSPTLIIALEGVHHCAEFLGAGRQKRTGLSFLETTSVSPHWQEDEAALHCRPHATSACTHGLHDAAFQLAIECCPYCALAACMHHHRHSDYASRSEAACMLFTRTWPSQSNVTFSKLSYGRSPWPRPAPVSLPACTTHIHSNIMATSAPSASPFLHQASARRCACCYS